MTLGLSRVVSWAPLAVAIACGPSLGPSPQDMDAGSDSTSGGAVPSGPGMVPGDSSGEPPPPATSTTDVTTASDSSDSTGNAFIEDPTGCGQVAPDGSTWHCTYTCDVIAQDCPSDEKCAPWANDGSQVWNSTRCSPIPPEPVPAGGACTVEGWPASGVDDCEQSAFCWEVDPRTLTGTCQTFCDGTDPDACDPSSVCAQLNDGVAPVCLSQCNPLDPVACAEGEVCRAEPADGLPVCVTADSASISGADGSCADDVCGPDALCASDDVLPSCDSFECCTPWCDLDDPAADESCASAVSGTSCSPYFVGVAPEGLESLGVCL